MTRRVVITGMGGVTAFGEDWPTISRRLREYENAVRTMTEWQAYDGLQTLLAAPIEDFTLPAHYTRKRIRAMGRVSLSTRATELALEQAGLIDDAVLTNGQTGIATARRPAAPGRSASLPPCSPKAHPQHHRHHLCADDAAHHGGEYRAVLWPARTGDPHLERLYLWQPGDWLRREAIRHGYQTVMVAGGAEELCPSEAAVFDTLFATSQRNDAPKPRRRRLTFSAMAR